MAYDGSIEYDRERFDEAIKLANKASAGVSGIASKMISINNIRLPGNSPVSAPLSGIISGLTRSFESIRNCGNSLKQMQTIIETALEDDYTMELLEKGYKVTEVESSDGIKGLVLVPPGHLNADGLPLITYISGQNENSNTDATQDHGLPYLISSGYELEAAVYIPINSSNRWTSYAENGSLMRAINEVATTYNVDPKRRVLVGYSMGGDAGYRLVANNPDYFSCYVTFSSSATGTGTLKKYKEQLGNSSTVFIPYMNASGLEQEYKILDEAGAQVMGYRFDSRHEDNNLLWSNDLLSDIININLGEKVVKENQMIVVGKEEMKNASLEVTARNNGGVINRHELQRPSYYHRLSGSHGNTNAPSNSTEDHTNDYEWQMDSQVRL